MFQMSTGVPAATTPGLAAGVGSTPRGGRKGKASSSSTRDPGDSATKSSRRVAGSDAHVGTRDEAVSAAEGVGVPSALSFASWLAGRNAAALEARDQYLSVRGASLLSNTVSTSPASSSANTSWWPGWLFPRSSAAPTPLTTRNSSTRPPFATGHVTSLANGGPQFPIPSASVSSLYLALAVLTVALVVTLFSPFGGYHHGLAPPAGIRPSFSSALVWRLLGWSAAHGSPEAVAAAAMAAVQEQAAAVEQLRALVGRLEQRSDTLAQALQVGGRGKQRGGTRTSLLL